MRSERSMSRRERLARAKRKKDIKRVVGAILAGTIILVGVQTVVAINKSREVHIEVKAKPVEVLLGEEMPKWDIQVKSEEKEEILLDKEKGYTVKLLLADLKKGKGYQVICESDGQREGTYPIHIELDSKMKEKEKSGWKRKVYIEAKDSMLTIKNNVGEWDGNQFKRHDGTYVQNEFVDYRGSRYFFGENQEKVTGWQPIGLDTYLFDEEGKMQTGWKKEEAKTRYLKPDGRMAVGWCDIEDYSYFFDPEGAMVTGKQTIGIQKCVFAEDGKLKKKKSQLDSTKPMMALTFDDGPGERTGELLDVLEKYNAHATFFMQGKNVEKYADVVKRMLSTGSELGNHSFDHKDLSKQPAEIINAQIDDTNGLLKQAAGQPATVMRPPYGAINDLLRKEADMPLILWNVDSEDWKSKDAQKVIAHVVETAGDGNIVLMHDVHSTTVDAAIELIPKLAAAGYQLVTVTELAESRGVKMEAGASYTECKQ